MAKILSVQAQEVLQIPETIISFIH